MQHLKHTKTDRVHNLEFSGNFNPMNSNFIVETEFQATALYEVGDTFTVNGTKFNATLNPNVYGLFMVNDMVHCVVDFYRKNLVIVNTHKAKFDALWVFNPKNPDVTEISSTANAMKDGSSEVITSLFFGYGDEGQSQMHNVEVGYSFSTRNLWANDNAADAVENPDTTSYPVITVTIMFGDGNSKGYPESTIHHTITRRCEMVSNVVTFNNMPSGDSTVKISVTGLVIQNSFTCYVQAPNMSTKKEIPIIYYKVPGKEDEAYMIGWNDFGVKDMVVPAVIPRTTYKCIGYLDRDTIASTNSYICYSSLVSDEDRKILNSYSSYITQYMFNSSYYTELNRVTWGSNVKFALINGVSSRNVNNKDYSGTMATYFDFSKCKSISWISHESTRTRPVNPVYDTVYDSETGLNLVDLSINADEEDGLIWGDISSLYYNGIFINNDKMTTNAAMTRRNNTSTYGGIDTTRLIKFSISKCPFTCISNYLFYYNSLKEVNCDADYFMIGTSYYTRYVSNFNSSISIIKKPLSSDYSVRDCIADYRRNYSKFESYQGRQYLNFPAISVDDKNYTSNGNWNKLTEEQRINVNFNFKTMVFTYYPYFSTNFSSSYYMYWNNININLNGGLLDVQYLWLPEEVSKVFFFYYMKNKLYDKSTYAYDAHYDISSYTIYGLHNNNDIRGSVRNNTESAYLSSETFYNSPNSQTSNRLRLKAKYIYTPYWDINPFYYTFTFWGNWGIPEGDDYYVFDIEEDMVASSLGKMISTSYSGSFYPVSGKVNPKNSSYSMYEWTLAGCVEPESGWAKVRVGGVLSLFDIANDACRGLYNGVFRADYNEKFQPIFELNEIGSLSSSALAMYSYQIDCRRFKLVLDGTISYNKIHKDAVIAQAALHGQSFTESSSVLDLREVGYVGNHAFGMTIGIDEIIYPDEASPIESMASTWFEGIISSSYRDEICNEMTKDYTEANFYQFRAYDGMLYYMYYGSGTYTNYLMTKDYATGSNYIRAFKFLDHIDLSKPFKFNCRRITNVPILWNEYKPISLVEDRDSFNNMRQFLYGEKRYTSQSYGFPNLGDPVYKFSTSSIGGSSPYIYPINTSKFENPEFEYADFTRRMVRIMHDSDIIPNTGWTANGKSIECVTDMYIASLYNDIYAGTYNSPVNNLTAFYRSGSFSSGASRAMHSFTYAAVLKQIIDVSLGNKAPEDVVFPKVEIGPDVEFIGAYFLCGFPVYFDPANPDDFEWKTIDLSHVKAIGDHPFAFTFFTDKSDPNKRFFYGDNGAGLAYEDENISAVEEFNGYSPIQTVILSEDIPYIPNGLDAIPNVIIPETNPNFCFENGYIYNADKTVLIKPSLSIDEIKAFTDDDEEIIIPDTVTTICCWNSALKYDRRIRHMSFHGTKLDLVDKSSDVYDDATKIHFDYGLTTFEFPPNLESIELPGQTNIPLRNLPHYPEGLIIHLYNSTTSSSKYYTPSGCSCGEIFTTESVATAYANVGSTYYADSIGNRYKKGSYWHHYATFTKTVQPELKNLTTSSVSKLHMVYSNPVNDDPLIDNIVINVPNDVYYLTTPNHVDQLCIQSSRAANVPLFTKVKFDNLVNLSNNNYSMTDSDETDMRHLIMYNGAKNVLFRVPPTRTGDYTITAGCRVFPGAFYGCTLDNLTIAGTVSGNEGVSYRYPTSNTETDGVLGYYGTYSTPSSAFEYQLEYTNPKPIDLYWPFAGLTVENLHVGLPYYNAGVCAMHTWAYNYYKNSSSATYNHIGWDMGYNEFVDTMYRLTTSNSLKADWDKKSYSRIKNLYIEAQSPFMPNITKIEYSLKLFRNPDCEDATILHFPEGTRIKTLGKDAIGRYQLADPDVLLECKEMGVDATKGTIGIPEYTYDEYDGYNIASGNQFIIKKSDSTLTFKNSTFDEIVLTDDSVNNDIVVEGCDEISSFTNLDNQASITVDKLYRFIKITSEEEFRRIIFSSGYGDSIPDELFGINSDLDKPGTYVPGIRYDWTYDSEAGGYVNTVKAYAEFLRITSFGDNLELITFLEGFKSIGSENYFLLKHKESESLTLSISSEVTSFNAKIWAVSLDWYDGYDENGYVKIKNLPEPTTFYPSEKDNTWVGMNDYTYISTILIGLYDRGDRNWLSVPSEYKSSISYISTRGGTSIETIKIKSKTNPVLGYIKQMYLNTGIVLDLNNDSITINTTLTEACDKISINVYRTSSIDLARCTGTKIRLNSKISALSLYNKRRDIHYTSSRDRIKELDAYFDENNITDPIDKMLMTVTSINNLGFLSGLEISDICEELDIFGLGPCDIIGIEELRIDSVGKVYWCGYTGMGKSPSVACKKITIHNICLERPTRWVSSSQKFGTGIFKESAVEEVDISLCESSKTWVETNWNVLKTFSTSGSTNATLGYTNDASPFYQAFYYTGTIKRINLNNITKIFPCMFYYTKFYSAATAEGYISELEEIATDEPITSIAVSAFSNAQVKTRNVSELFTRGTGSVVDIQGGAFRYSNMYMTDFSSCIYIGDAAFYQVTFPENGDGEVILDLPVIESIGSNAFYGTNITKVRVKAGCTYGSNAFPGDCLVLETY